LQFGEFPELQGIMGGYYARAKGEDEAVADAIRDHYKPVGQGDDVPTAPVTVAVSLADKLDTLACFFAVRLLPTGSKDPFALRRACIGVADLITTNAVRLRLSDPIGLVRALLFTQITDRLMVLGSVTSASGQTVLARQVQTLEVGDGKLRLVLTTESGDVVEVVVDGERAQAIRDINNTINEFAHDGRSVVDFFADRLKVQQREAGVWHDLIDAVFALGGEDDLVRLLARVKALQAFVGTEDGVNLLAGYKRAANFLKSSPERGGGPLAVEGQSAADGAALAAPPPSRDGSPPRSGEELVELALLAALDTAEPLAAAAIEAEDFAAAMTALASLRAPIDAFFEGVMVNDPDLDKRTYRLGLLTRFRDAVHRVADFSKIEG
jgi:glycyl-tRNA synthetase beta chain